MSKKKLLKESTIRRFGGLAGIKPATTSNFLSEMGMDIPYDRDEKEDDDMMQEMGMDKPAYERDDEVEMDVEEEPVEDEPPMEEPAAEGGEADELVMSLLSKVSEWAADHGVEMDVDEEGEGGEEMDMDMDMEMDLGGEGEGEGDEGEGDEGEGGEEVDMEMGEEETLEEMINSILSEEEEEEEEEPAKTESIKIVDDNEIIQEVAKRVKQRLARIAKSQRKNK